METCEVGHDGFCYTCQMHKDEHDQHLMAIRDEEVVEQSWAQYNCIGAECCNPYVDHERDECFTAEMVEAWVDTLE